MKSLNPENLENPEELKRLQDYLEDDEITDKNEIISLFFGSF